MALDTPQKLPLNLPQTLSVHESKSGNLITLRLNPSVLAIENVEVAYRHVIAANFYRDTQLVDISYLDRKNQRANLSLINFTGVVENTEKDIKDVVSNWIETLMYVSYEGAGVKRNRRLKVLVNPFGGPGNAATIYTTKVEPIFKAAGCSLNVIHTSHHGHAFDIAKVLNFNYDAVVTLSGDGLIHEVMNGFANHKDPQRAFAIPVAPIPTGSGNGLSLNILGFERGFDVTEAALNVIKGRPMKVDACSVTQNGKRAISFMSQAVGLMADLDIGTEHLRWLGDARFVVGLFRGLIQLKHCPIQLSVKVAESDKKKIMQNFHTRRSENEKSIPRTPSLSSAAEDVESGPLPPLKYSSDDTDGWITVDEPILYLYAGKGPYVGRDLMAFPASQPNDGLIDVTVVHVSSRKDVLVYVNGAAKGESFWSENLKYFKAHAYRVKPLNPEGCLSVDGEHFPFEEFQVEVHSGLATFLSPYGHYAAEFPPEPPSRSRRLR